MARELYMLGLIVDDMPASLAFYRRLGLAIPEDSETQTHVEVKMGSGFTFFLDSHPARWDGQWTRDAPAMQNGATTGYRTILEFYLETRDAVDHLYGELTDSGYQSYRAPYETTFGMYFAMVKDPDGNTVLLSGDINHPSA